MFNSIEAFIEAGTKAAKAQNVGDAATVRHWRDHFNAMRDLETGEARTAANQAYRDAYTAARNVPR